MKIRRNKMINIDQRNIFFYLNCLLHKYCQLKVGSTQPIISLAFLANTPATEKTFWATAEFESTENSVKLSDALRYPSGHTIIHQK